MTVASPESVKVYPYTFNVDKITVKTLNIGTPRPATAVVLNLKQFNFTMKKMPPKDVERMANSVDSDQTAPQSDQNLDCLLSQTCPNI